MKATFRPYPSMSVDAPVTRVTCVGTGGTVTAKFIAALRGETVTFELTESDLETALSEIRAGHRLAAASGRPVTVKTGA